MRRGILTLFALLAFAACGDDTTTGPEPTALPEFSIIQDHLTLELQRIGMTYDTVTVTVEYRVQPGTVDGAVADSVTGAMTDVEIEWSEDVTVVIRPDWEDRNSKEPRKVALWRCTPLGTILCGQVTYKIGTAPSEVTLTGTATLVAGGTLTDQVVIVGRPKPVT